MADGRDDGWGDGSSLPPPPSADDTRLPPPPGGGDRPHPQGWGPQGADAQGWGQQGAPSPQQPGWGGVEPGYGPGAPTPQRNGLALASLICGLGSLGCLLLFFLLITVPLAVVLGIAAVVTGILGLRAVGRDGLGGRGQAIAGIVTGALSIAIVVLLSVLAIGAWQQFGFESNPFTDPEGFVEELEERGIEVDEDGQVDLDELERQLEEDVDG
jgi:hypothetical protein